MADLIIRDERLARRLLNIAQRENRSVEAVIETMLEQYDQPEPGTLAALAESALNANIRSDKPVDTSARSREILRTEFADYIRRKLDKPQPDTD